MKPYLFERNPYFLRTHKIDHTQQAFHCSWESLQSQPSSQSLIRLIKADSQSGFQSRSPTGSGGNHLQKSRKHAQGQAGATGWPGTSAIHLAGGASAVFGFCTKLLAHAWLPDQATHFWFPTISPNKYPRPWTHFCSYVDSGNFLSQMSPESLPLAGTGSTLGSDFSTCPSSLTASPCPLSYIA